MTDGLTRFASHSSDQILAHAAVLMKDFTVCQQANTSQFVAPIDTHDGQNFNERRTGHIFDLD